MPYKDPEKQRQACKESARRHRTRCATEKKRKTKARRIKTADDVRRVLVEAVNAVREIKADPIVKGRAVGYLCGVILKALEVGDLEERIVRLEQSIEERDTP